MRVIDASFRSVYVRASIAYRAGEGESLQHAVAESCNGVSEFRIKRSRMITFCALVLVMSGFVVYIPENEFFI